jgi:deoxyribose-phosphate aldolase
MLVELACYNQDSTLDDILEATFIASQKGLKSVAIPSGFMPKVNGFLDDQKFSAAIDFPYGLSSTQVRIHEIILSIRQGASYIDLVINAGYIKEENWKAIKDDLKSCIAACEPHKILLRPIIEYRLFPSKIVLNLCESLDRLGIEHIINSTGFVADDVAENLLFSYEVQRKTGVAVTSCLKGIHEKHLIALKELDIYGLRLMSPKIAESIL